MYPKCTSRSSWLSTVESTILSTTFPTIEAIESAISRQLTVSGGLDEAVSKKQSGVPTKHELYHLQLAVSRNLPYQIILNLRGNESMVSLRCGREIPQVAP
ncbi:hypothetical protein CR513_16107, partial [Mucuna pruriens]